jgi:glycerophosphoryl diester phosphodiesterase
MVLMSIEQSDVIDIISTDRITGDVTLTISDHLDWTDSGTHQVLLQKKLNRYLAFVESGEILQSYPTVKGRQITINVVFKHPPDESGRAFLSKVRPIIESAGWQLRETISTGASRN